MTTSRTRWHDVGAVEELEGSGRLVARLDGREIGILRLEDGRLAGIRNRCPHSGAPLCLGTLVHRLAGTPGRYADSGRTVLRCPWHGWEFDVGNGECADEPALRVAVYPARIEAGRVLVEA